jgi:hypothetical protein
MLEDFSSKCSKSYVRRLKRDLQVAPECVVGLLDDIVFSKTGYSRTALNTVNFQTLEK